MSFILIILFGSLSWFARQWLVFLREKLLGHLIHTDEWSFWIICTLIHIQNILHLAHNRSICFWRNAIHFLQPRLKFVFFSAARIVSRSEEHTSELQSQSNLVCRL